MGEVEPGLFVPRPVPRPRTDRSGDSRASPVRDLRSALTKIIQELTGAPPLRKVSSPVRMEQMDDETPMDVLRVALTNISPRVMAV
jgi:hypothetical protein